jgi:hypothetical protein
MLFETGQRRDAPHWRWFCGLLLAILLLGGCAEAGQDTIGGVQSAATGSEPTAIATAAVTAPVGSATTGATSTSAATIAAATASTSRQALGGTPSVTADPARASAATPSAATPGAAPADEPAITSSSNSGGGGGNNVVRIDNHNDGRMLIRGNVDLNRIPGPNVGPVNAAYAYSSCTDCQTIAVALQINLISRTATHIAPENYAVAINQRCTRCVTVARAIQYTYQVDDPQNTPKEVSDLLNEMDRTLREIANDKGISLAEAEGRINAVIAQFRDLAASLNDQRQADTADNGSGTPGPAGTPTTTGTPQATGTVAPTSTATPGTPSASPSPTAGSTPTPSPAITPAATATPTPSASPTTPASPTVSPPP